MTKISLTLAIDDDEISLNIAKWYLKKHHVFGNCLAYSSPADAMNLLNDMVANNQPLPDVILLDLNMPVMDGWEVLDKLKQNDHLKNIPVAILTSSIDPLDRLKASGNAQVIDFIEKPYSNDKLDKLAEKLLNNKDSKQAS